MKPIKLKKIHWTKKRFVRSTVFSSYFQWFDLFTELKEKIARDSFYQKVERSCHIEYNSKAREFCILIEVVGVLNERFPHQHFEESDVLVYELQKDLLEGDFEEILRIASEILTKLPSTMADVFHLVIDQDKLALHFFNQKDYSLI